MKGLIPIIESAPAAFHGIAERVNAIIRYGWREYKGEDGIETTESNTNVVISAKVLLDRIRTLEENGPGGGVDYRCIRVTISPSDPVPTVAEIRTAIQNVYTGESLTPASGDWIFIEDSGVQKLVYQVVPNFINSPSTTWDNTPFRLTITLSSVTYRLVAFQTGLY